MAGPKETLFEGENFQLSFQFNGKYPFDSPIVTFTRDSISMHPYFYYKKNFGCKFDSIEWKVVRTVKQNNEKGQIFWIALSSNAKTYSSISDPENQNEN